MEKEIIKNGGGFSLHKFVLYSIGHHALMHYIILTLLFQLLLLLLSINSYYQHKTYSSRLLL
jgi:hypothetical protein